MSDEKPNRCLFCGKDCSFYAHCDGCCLGCGDSWMANGPLLLRTYVGALKRLIEERSPSETVNLLMIGQMDQLASENREMRESISLCSGSCRTPEQQNVV